MKKIASTTLLGLAAVVLGAADLSAQVCNGTASFATQKMRAGLALEFPDNATGIGGEFALGTPSGLYGGANLSMVDYDNVDEGATVFGLSGGKSMPIGKDKKVEMCPQLMLVRQSGPNATNFEQSMTAFGGGVTFGSLMKQTSFDLIPFGGALIHRDMFSATVGGVDSEASDTNIDLVAGAGFVLSKKWTLRPSINVPLTNDREATISISGLLHFGGK